MYPNMTVTLEGKTMISKKAKATATITVIVFLLVIASAMSSVYVLLQSREAETKTIYIALHAEPWLSLHELGNYSVMADEELMWNLNKSHYLNPPYLTPWEEITITGDVHFHHRWYGVVADYLDPLGVIIPGTIFDYQHNWTLNFNAVYDGQYIIVYPYDYCMDQHTIHDDPPGWTYDPHQYGNYPVTDDNWTGWREPL